MSNERCLHDEYRSICIVCMHDATVAALHAELAEVKRECEWPRYKDLAAENGRTALAIEAEREREWKRANHWMAVALAFRDATTDAATEARDGERDPYLERAQDLYNATARDFGPVAEYNRFFCDCCDDTVMVDEDGLCATCGGDTWRVFEPIA